MNAWPKQSQLAQFYGNPDANGNGEADLGWEDANLIRFMPPWSMVLAWDPAKTIRSFRIHRKCFVSLKDVFDVIWVRAGQSQDRIERDGLHLFGGSYNFRLTRHGTRLSTHAYGCAIDLNPEGNRMGWAWNPEDPNAKATMPLYVVEAFESEGWVFGGRWVSRPDAMHFQAAVV